MSIFPSNYIASNEKDPDAPRPATRYFNAKDLKEGESITLRLCGTPDNHAIAGYQYFTMEGKPRRFPKFPVNYLEDIGLSYEARKSGGDEKAEPTYFLAWACQVRGEEGFKIWDISQFGIRETVEKILKMEDYDIEPGEMANFYLTIDKSKVNNKVSYSVVPTLKVASKEDQEAWRAARGEIFLPALFEGGDPFKGQPSDGGQKSRPQMPITARDELGADKELEAAGW